MKPLLSAVLAGLSGGLLGFVALFLRYYPDQPPHGAFSVMAGFTAVAFALLRMSFEP